MSTQHGIFDAIDHAASSALARRIAAVRSGPSPDAVPVLKPPLSDARDHIEGPPSASASLVVFGSYGTPASPRLGRLLQQLHAAHPASLRVAWRHLPDLQRHPGATAFALAAEAAATEGRFWALHRELLATRHNDLEDLHAAARRAGLDFYRMLDRMRTGVGAERIVSDLESAVASSVVSAPTLFVNGERFDGERDTATVWAAASRLQGGRGS